MRRAFIILTFKITFHFISQNLKSKESSFSQHLLQWSKHLFCDKFEANSLFLSGLRKERNLWSKASLKIFLSSTFQWLNETSLNLEEGLQKKAYLSPSNLIFTKIFSLLQRISSTIQEGYKKRSIHLLSFIMTKLILELVDWKDMIPSNHRWNIIYQYFLEFQIVFQILGTNETEKNF